MASENPAIFVGFFKESRNVKILVEKVIFRKHKQKGLQFANLSFLKFESIVFLNQSNRTENQKKKKKTTFRNSPLYQFLVPLF